jgi:hypothetical protein
MEGGEEFEIETDDTDSTDNAFDLNSPEGRTLAQIYAKRFQERSDKLAGFVNDEVEKTGRTALGISQRQKGIWVLQATNMPAILIETGFINNPEDEHYLNSKEGQQELAEAITAAVKRYKEQVEGTNKNLSQNVDAKPITPAQFESRPNIESKVLQVESDKIKVEIYDDGEIDNDMVSVYFNKGLVVANKSLSAQAYSFNLNLEPGKTNELVLYADNLGSIPPNTALMIITDGINRYEVRLSTDLNNNASVRFELKPGKP